MINSSAPTLKGIPYSAVHRDQNGPIPADAPTPKGLFKSLDIGADLDSVEIDRKSEPALPEPMQFKLGNTSLQGHLASDPQHARYPSARYEIRTFMPVGSGQIASVDFDQLFKSNAVPAVPSKRYVVTNKQIDQGLKETAAEREQQLKSGELKQGLRVIPKDGSLNPENVAIFMRSEGDVSTRYTEQLSKIGQIEGFHMVAGCHDGSGNSYEKRLAKGGYQNVSLLETPSGEAWVEDYGEPVVGGGRVFPAIFNDNWGRFVKNAIAEGRKERFSPEGLDGVFGYHGAVNQGGFQTLSLAQAIAENGYQRQALSYLEGGNIYPGTLANGDGYCLIGKDSWQVTKKLLEDQTDRKWSTEEVREAIAADLGLKPENVHAIEQPGQFHLDMRLTAIGPGEIMLNDSVAAYEKQVEWMKADLKERAAAEKMSDKEVAREEREIAERAELMKEQAELAARYEAITERDLKAAGFTVERVPGVFVDLNNPQRDTANYFNARHGTNEQGERFAILMGGKPREEAFVAQEIFDAADGNISRIHFLDPKVTQKTLDMMGGLKCRTKPGGEIVSADEWNNPQRAQLQTA